MTQEDLSKKISDLKEEKNGIILAHNYQIPEVQLEADHLGDSLGLARKSSEVDADIVVFAGVDFMAETAAMLNPEKKVLIPDREARCPMAGMLPVKLVREAKRDHPDAAVVLYVNTLAEARAEADVTCTSANSVQVVNALDEDEILFGPDRNLAWHVEQNTGKEIIPIPEDGYCYVHRMFSPEDIRLLKEEHPDAEVLVHPESAPEVQKLADYICSTSQMLGRAEKSSADEFVITTEVGLVHRLGREFPEKNFYPVLDEGICREMKKHDLEKVYRSLRDEKFVVEVPSEVAESARRATERMLEISS
ncbi:quinolinate synthase A [candidate division MSBL1 archaeon SCGC-AAA259A05]|uniref:Quinolinate synthase n=1 Tax=candidate division MSBL1 archaeon SCGC-AAA259A05 TaxID=1698259 RepID=A0A133U7F2_9EURY|nr:quinolinate synthase A [candidate division MSBL1 archaeon SCGC-AAA259A05]